MRITGGWTPDVAPCVASRICGAARAARPAQMRHSPMASPLGCRRYHATSAVPAALTSTVGVSPVPGSRVSFADAAAGRTRGSRAGSGGSAHRRIVSGHEDDAVRGRGRGPDLLDLGEGYGAGPDVDRALGHRRGELGQLRDEVAAGDRADAAADDLQPGRAQRRGRDRRSGRRPSRSGSRSAARRGRRGR